MWVCIQYWTTMCSCVQWWWLVLQSEWFCQNFSFKIVLFFSLFGLGILQICSGFIVYQYNYLLWISVIVLIGFILWIFQLANGAHVKHCAMRFCQSKTLQLWIQNGGKRSVVSMHCACFAITSVYWFIILNILI